MDKVSKKIMILEKAALLFSRKGFYGAGLNELLTACDIPKGSFYYYFPQGKNQLAMEVLQMAYERMEGYIIKNFETNPTALSSFDHMVSGHIEILYRKKETYYYSLLLSLIGIESVFMDDQRINDGVKNIYQRWQRLYQQKLLDCGYDDDQASQLAQVMFSVVHGTLISSWIKQDNEDLKKIKAYLPHILDK
ncbi:MAG: TetR/AcrR family transcriptional regulator [Erysipelotrichaceae bacterium]|nr:TetR/AcrR family transcriptional regulator [Erysipelotrichaceae bacterium]MDY5252533.1 TetR/AcrR family transcriptional regulator [Erysipelotrichaceae bacterium]